MRAVEQSAGGKLFHHVVESDKVAAGILKEVNRIKLAGVFTLPNKIDSFRPMQGPDPAPVQPDRPPDKQRCRQVMKSHTARST